MIAEAIPREISLEEIPLELIDIGTNVRVDPGELEEMASSIRELGVLQPVKVHGPLLNGHYVLLWGQRRVLASRLAERITIPAIVMGFTEDKAGRPIEQLVENLQRADLNPIEEANAIRDVLAGDRKLTQATLGEKLGRSQAWIANTLGLLKAPEVIRTAIAEGTLTASHAKAVSGLVPKEQERLAKNAIEQGYSAHQLERDAKYVSDRQKDLDKRSKETEGAGKNAVAALRAAEVPEYVPVIVRGNWQLDNDRIREEVKAAGFTIAEQTYGFDRTEGCDCTTVSVSIDEKKVAKVLDACVSDAHRDAAYKARRAGDLVKEKAAEKEQAAIAKAAKAALEAQPPHPTVVRLLLRAFDSYAGKAWSEYAKLTDAQALAALAENLSTRSGAAYGKPVPTKTVLASLGATVKP